MTEVLRYEVGSGTVLVEVDDNSYGVNHPARNEQGILDVGRRLEDALASVRPAAAAVVEAMRELAPEQMQIEFGVKLAGEAGAVIARSSAEGHFILRMSWPAAADIPLEEE
ncbi:CU044_2847 family protein [Arthrobacter sp. 754]|uniref:CU044_2847 family protein n=1 Tax=Arthrobacter sp. 754 TaxID=3156315 RepID=UPI003398672D